MKPLHSLVLFLALLGVVVGVMFYWHVQETVTLKDEHKHERDSLDLVIKRNTFEQLREYHYRDSLEKLVKHSLFRYDSLRLRDSISSRRYRSDITRYTKLTVKQIENEMDSIYREYLELNDR